MRYRGVPKPGGCRGAGHSGGLDTEVAGRTTEVGQHDLCVDAASAWWSHHQTPTGRGSLRGWRNRDWRWAEILGTAEALGSEAASVCTLTHRVVIPPSGAPSCPAIYYQDILGVILDHGEIKPPYQDICHVDCRLKQSSHIGRGKMRRPSRAWHAHWAHAWKTSWSLVF